MEWQENTFRLNTFAKDVSPAPLGVSFPRPAWVKLNCFQTSIVLFSSEMHKWGMASMVACECGAKEQTADHVITSCPIYHHPNGAHALSQMSTGVW